MLFNSIQYVFFLPVMVIVYYLIPTVKIRNVWLLVGSYYFYMNWNAAYGLLLLTATAVTYVGGIAVDALREKKYLVQRRRCLAVCLLINLGILCTFKYLAMFVSYLNKLLAALHVPALALGWNPVLPVGISFFTLQAIGYLIDVYRGDIAVQKNFITYALFVSFFPQLVAGPIERSGNLLVQLKKFRKFNYLYLQKGLVWILYGLMVKMVIADNLSIFVDLVYSDPATYPGWYLVAATFAFTIQIYCDFYGYSIIAKGSAYLFGVKLMSNFESPYFAKSVKEFWRRWHISLSTWFRDYLYIPLGGNRKGLIRRDLNLFLVFLVSGLWHGASIAFVFWGMLNGIYQIIGNLIGYAKKRLGIDTRARDALFSRRLLKNVCTFVLIAFTWIPFRAGNWTETKRIVHYMIHYLGNYEVMSFGNVFRFWEVMPAKMAYGAFLGILILAVVDYLKYKKMSVVDRVVAQELWMRYAVCIGLLLFVLNCGCYGETYNPAQFIYFQF